MLVTPTSLQALFTMFDMKFQSVFQDTPTYIDKLATTVPSNTEQNTYPWVGRLPTMREWIGDRVVNNAMAKSYTIVNAKFEQTEGLQKSKIDDDQYGLFSSMIIPMMAFQAKKYPDYRFISTLQANGLWADGKAYFATDHPVNVDDASFGTFSNEHTSTPLTHNNYSQGRATMLARIGEDGKSLGVNPTALIIPPQLEPTAKLIINSDTMAGASFGNETTQVGATTNVNKGTAEIIMIPELSNQPDTWYLADLSKPIRPFLWQLREAVSFAYRIDPKDPVVFDKDMYLYGARARGEAGLVFPFLADRFAA